MEDAEIVHTVAPDAVIRVILIPRQSSPGSWVAAADAVLRLALSQGAVVSIGDGVSDEQCLTSAEVAGLNSALQAAQDHHVTVVSSTGDLGAASAACSSTARPVKEVGLPASDPLVLAAGGTSLDADHATGAYIGETAWNSPAGPSVSAVPSPAGPSVSAAPSASGPTGGIPEASGGGSVNCFPGPLTKMASPGSGRTVVCPTWPRTPTPAPA